MTVLQVTGLTKRYPKFTLDQVSFSLGEGRIMGLIGKNGAGKSTTIKAMLDLVCPDGGTIQMFGQDFRRTQRACKQRLGVVLGGVDFYPAKRLKDITAATRRFYQEWDEGAYRRYMDLFELDSGKRVDSLVLMGIGEPLDNYDNVVRFLRLLSSPEGLNLSLRHISLSTCGLVDQIDRLAQEKMGLTLSISLHATDDATRSEIMPVNRRWPMEELLAACKRYFAVTGRRVSFEYALIAGVNDSPQQARQLARLLDGFGCHVNLIPVNKVKERPINRRSSREAIAAFAATLQKLGVNATVRRELGADINAACGQLRREHREEGAWDHA